MIGDPNPTQRAQLRLLGSVAVTVGTTDATAALSHPKRLALIAWLALTRPYGLHRRDTLCALFWPESSGENARAALRQLLQVVRRELGEQALITEADLVGLNSAVVISDARDVLGALEAGDDARGVDAYGGELLPGLHVPEAEGFERWLEEQRRQLHRMVTQAAWRLVEQAENAGNVGEAVRRAARAMAIDGENEAGLRHLIALEARVGDRAAALRTFEQFERRIKEDWGTAPEPVTLELVEQIRRGKASTLGASGDQPPSTVLTRPVAEVDMSQGDRILGHRTSRRRWLAAALAGIGILGTLGYGLTSSWRGQGASTPSLNRPFIAVLPLENLGAAEDQYFVDGMTEEITSRLARLSRLGVISRSSAIQYRRTNKPARQIGQELGVQYLLEGTVRWERNRDGSSRVRITPRLIRTSDATHIWAEAYEAELEGVFGLQSDIAEQVAKALRVTLLAEEQPAIRSRPTQNMEAHDDYLRGLHYFRRRYGQDWEGQRLALEFFEKAVAKDPSFGQAYVQMAVVQIVMLAGYDAMMTGVPRSKRLAMAGQAAERAVALLPDLPEAHLAMAGYHGAAGDTVRRLQELEIALKAESSDGRAFLDRGWALFYQGDSTAALESFDTALRLDPRNVEILPLLANGYLGLNKFAKAHRVLELLLVLAPDNPRTYIIKAWAHVWNGEVSEARAVLARGAAAISVSDLLVDISRHSAYIRLIRIFDAEYGAAMRGLSIAPWGTDTADYLLAKAMAHHGDPAGARLYYDSIAAWTRPRIQTDPQQLFYHIILAMAQAGAGLREASMATLRRRPSSRVDFLYSEMMAEVLTTAGSPDAALDELETAMGDPRPGYPGFPHVLSRTLLELDPVWNPIRGHPRFKKLLER